MIKKSRLVPGASIVIGVFLIGISAISRGWLSSLLLNLGTSIFLVVPIVLIGRRMEASVMEIENRTEEGITAVQNEVAELRTESMQTLDEIRNQYRAVARDNQEHLDAVVADLVSYPSRKSLVEALDTFISNGTLSRRGVRVKYGRPSLYVTLTLDEGAPVFSISRYLENEVLVTARWDSGNNDPVAFLTGVNRELVRAGELDEEKFDPGQIFSELAELIRIARVTRDKRVGEDPGPAVMLCKPQWMLFDDGISTTGIDSNPGYFVAYNRLNEVGWRKQVGEKPWVDYDSFDEALSWAESVPAR